MSSTSVRRNLFHQNLSRRPASAGPPDGNVPPGNNALSSRPSHRLKTTASDSSSSRSIKLSDNREIAVRDKNGGYKLDVPALPHVLVGEDGEELGALDAEDSGEAGFDVSVFGGREKEKFEAALVEMMIRHRNRQTSGEPDVLAPTEILDIVHQSLRRKVASLDEDNWMFEPEKDTRL